MSRYIDADRLLADLPKLCHSINDSNNCRACPLFDTEDDYCMVERFIEEEPDADVAGIVRCKDCKYGDLANAVNGGMWCDRYMMFSMQESYCRNGQRRRK